MGLNYSHLSVKEREIIFDLHYKGHNVSYIANILNRHRSTIPREMKRNWHPFCGYRPYAANREYLGRKFKKAHMGCKLTPKIKRYINYLLRNFRFSANSIVHFIKIELGVQLAPETIYRYIIKDKKHHGDLYKHLPRYRKRKRRVKGSDHQSQGRIQKKRIEERPISAENRLQLGHLEADLIIGSDKEVILTMADRKSIFLVTRKIDSKKKDDVKEAILECLPKFKTKIKTITTDNGKYFFCFIDLEEELDVKFYFANPYHSWEKGLIENLNAFIRIYLKKGSKFENISNETLGAITNIINLIPRKTLNKKTALEVAHKIKKIDFEKNLPDQLLKIKNIFKENNFKVTKGII